MRRPTRASRTSTGILAERWPGLLRGLHAVGGADRVRRLAVDAGSVSHATWERLRQAAPDVELVAAGDWVAEMRATKEPGEIERVAAACVVADQALEKLLPSVRPGSRSASSRSSSSGPSAPVERSRWRSTSRACLAHVRRSRTARRRDRPIRPGEVLLFDFGAQVAGYRSDMTRTLFVNEPLERDLRLYRLVAEAQEAAFELLAATAEEGTDATVVLTPRMVDAAARGVIESAGMGEQFGHGLGHGIGLATHEAPYLGRRAPDLPLPFPTVFSVEPGVYLDGEVGVRIEDLVVYDPGAGRCERLTGFPREATVVGA